MNNNNHIIFCSCQSSFTSKRKYIRSLPKANQEEGERAGKTEMVLVCKTLEKEIGISLIEI